MICKNDNKKKKTYNTGFPNFFIGQIVITQHTECRGRGERLLTFLMETPLWNQHCMFHNRMFWTYRSSIAHAQHTSGGETNAQIGFDPGKHCVKSCRKCATLIWFFLIGILNTFLFLFNAQCMCWVEKKCFCWNFPCDLFVILFAFVP